MAGMLRFLLVLLLSAALAQGQLTCFFKTAFPKYTSAEQEIDVLFSIEAPSASAPSVSLTSVLDRSGSMKGSKIDLLKKTQQFLVNKLAEAEGRNSLGIVTYSNLVRELSSVQPVTSGSKDVLNALIAGISTAGTTNIGGGLAKGLEQQNGAAGGKLKSVYLFTDGIPTDGPKSTEEILAIVRDIQSQSSEKITISTFGFGSDLDIGLLKAIANAGGGEAYIISNENDIPVAFGDALGGLLSTSAEDIVVTFKPINGASIERLQTGGDVSFGDGTVSVKFSNLFAEEERDILLKMKIPEGSSKEEIVEATITYVDGSTIEKVVKNVGPLALDRSSDEPSDETPEKDVETAGLKFETAEALAVATAKASSGDTSGAATAVATAIAKVEVSPVKDDPTIQALLKDIQSIKELLEKQEEGKAAEKAGELEGTLTSQRSVSSNTDLESAKVVDTTAKQETRDETKDAVLSQPPLSTPAEPSVPAPAPEADPTPEPVTAVEPAPEQIADQTAAADLSPEPAPTPVLEPSPEPAPTVGPAPEVAPEPVQSPEPATEPAPVPAPEAKNEQSDTPAEGKAEPPAQESKSTSEAPVPEDSSRGAIDE